MTNPLRAVLGIALLFAVLVGITTARALGAGKRALADSDAASTKGDYAMAITFARDAAEAVAPGSPYPRQGYARLEAIARGAEERGDERIAVSAWGSMRSAATATASPFASTDAWRAEADDGLVRVGAHGGADTGETHASETTLRTALSHEDAPSTGLLALLGIGALAFFGGSARLAFAARDVASLWKEKRALATVAAGAILYVVACFRA